MPRVIVPISDEDETWLKEQAEAQGSDSPALVARMLIRWARLGGMKATLSFHGLDAPRYATDEVSLKDYRELYRGTSPNAAHEQSVETVDVDALVDQTLDTAEVHGLTETTAANPESRSTVIPLGPRPSGFAVAVPRG